MGLEHGVDGAEEMRAERDRVWTGGNRTSAVALVSH